MKCVGFEPVADKSARVLILGTLPGAESLKRREYYAKSTIRFWRLMEELLGALPADYSDRLHTLTRAGIALWDVCRSAERDGSLDSKIIMSAVKPNDFPTFLREHPRIELVCFNGRIAERIFRRKAAAGISNIRFALLPSSSAAHAIAHDQKVSSWRRALTDLIQHS